MSDSTSEKSYSNSFQEPEVNINSIRKEGRWESFGKMPEKYLFHMIKKLRIISGIVIVNENKNNPCLLVSSLSNDKIRYSKVLVDFGRSERIVVGGTMLETFYGVRQEYKLHKPIPFEKESERLHSSYYIQITYKKKMGLFKKKWERKIKTFYKSKNKSSSKKFTEWFEKARQNTHKYKF